MTDERIKESIAPCGLCCETCFAHVDGEIRRYSLKLKEKLGNFHVNATRFETLLDNLYLANTLLSRRCWTILPRKIVGGVAMNSASCLKTVAYARVIRKSRLIFATSVRSFPATKPILILAYTKDG